MKRGRKSLIWTPAEDQALLTKPMREVMGMFPNRTYHALNSRKYRLTNEAAAKITTVKVTKKPTISVMNILNSVLGSVNTKSITLTANKVEINF